MKYTNPVGPQPTSSTSLPTNDVRLAAKLSQVTVPFVNANRYRAVPPVPSFPLTLCKGQGAIPSFV